MDPFFKEFLQQQAAHTERLIAIQDDIKELKTSVLPNGHKRVEDLEDEVEVLKTHRNYVVSVVGFILAVLPFGESISKFLGLK